MHLTLFTPLKSKKKKCQKTAIAIKTHIDDLRKGTLEDIPRNIHMSRLPVSQPSNVGNHDFLSDNRQPSALEQHRPGRLRI